MAASPYAPPQTAIDTPVVQEETATPSSINPLLVTGIILLVNAVFGLLEMVLVRTKGGFSSPVPFIVDIVVGVGLIQNKPKYRNWAIFRSILGLVVYSALHLSQGDWVTMIFNAMYVAALLMLLLGQPSKLRLWSAVALAGICMMLEMVGLAMLSSGNAG